jgi:hypothetical protein
MIKLAFKFAVFLVGVGAGVYLAAHFPALGAAISNAEANRINAAVAQAKVDVLTQVVNDQQAKPAVSASSSLMGNMSNLVGAGPATDPNVAKYQAMLAQSKADLAAASAK